MTFRFSTAILALSTLLWVSGPLVRAQASTGEAAIAPNPSKPPQNEDRAKAADLGGAAPVTLSDQGNPITQSQKGLCQIGKELSTKLDITAEPTGRQSESVLPPDVGKTQIGGFPLTTQIVGGLLNQSRPRADYQCRAE